MTKPSKIPDDKPVACSIGWEPVASDSPFESRWFNVRRDTIRVPGHESPIRYHYVVHPGSVVVTPMTSDGRVVLIESYRYPTDRWCWEVPAGRVEPGVDPRDTARAELREEIGATCDELTHLATLQIANGFADCQTHFYLAHGVSMNFGTNREPGEYIRAIEALPLEEAIARLSAEGQDGDSALGLLLASRAIETSPPRVGDA